MNSIDTQEMKRPQLSVIIASCVGPPFIDRCLKSLGKQLGQADVEFIVVDRAGDDIAAGIQRDFPWVKLVRRPPGESVPDLRRHGIYLAQADYVAIIEEHCVASDNWIKTILRCIQTPIAAIGGPVADANYKRLMDWAVYFTEYNAYMPPVERAETLDVCAANCVYRRDLLTKYLPLVGAGYWEAGLNTILLAEGERFVSEPELVVYHTGPFGFLYYLRQRYLFSRAFAGTRRAHTRLWFRVAYLLLAPLLVPMLVARTASRVLAKRHRTDKFIKVLPHMIPIAATYVFGEWVGFVAGSGDSLSKIE